MNNRLPSQECPLQWEFTILGFYVPFLFVIFVCVLFSWPYLSFWEVIEVTIVIFNDTAFPTNKQKPHYFLQNYLEIRGNNKIIIY